MSKRRRRGRTRDRRRPDLSARRPRDQGICDLPGRAAGPTTSAPSSALAATNSTSLLARRLSMLLFHLLCVVASAGASPEAAQVEGNNVSSFPVILRSEHRQLFKGLRQRQSEPDESAQDVISFLGIRYASAPVRRLRFMPPTPFNYAPNQVHEARHFGPICMQRFPVDFNAEQRTLIADLLAAGGGGPANESAPAARLRAAQLELMERLLASSSGRFRPLLELEQSEDCLNLNIQVPLEATKSDGLRLPEVSGAERRRADPANLRPVLVVIHGDSFDYGAGSTISGARRFAASNGLLVVTFNYRLNLLGFPPTVAGAGGHARANLGLLDQVALLHWLQANIRSFGGAPRNVTLLGAGRGALFVNLLMLSPLAKGLFQRAILEDGTALSPMLANGFPQQQQVGWQHLRLLASMADCWTAQSGADQQQLASADDLRRPFECLKSSPVGMLMQPVPLGLLDASAGSPGELVLARRWHRPLELLLRNLLEQSLVAADARRSLNELANRIISSEGSQQAVQLTTGQLNHLIAQLVAARISIKSQAGPADSWAVERVSELLDELLSAIYLPSNETLVAHPFAPQLEPGTLLAHGELDLAGSMLQSQSSFGQHDLLIGSARPLVDFDDRKWSEGDGTELDQAWDSKTDSAESNRAFSELVQANERFGGRILRKSGLTDEQAIQQMGLFVRTHFRYHQQEIANSIISHYFLGDQLTASTRRSHQTSVSAATRSEPSETARLKQIQLLDSLMTAYEDSLVNVPLVKTALVHSLKQLEALADLFVGQKVYRLSELVRQADADVPKLLAEEQRKLGAIELDFLHFAQQLYNRTSIWPLDELWPSNQTFNEQQPHSTYFYQLEAARSTLAKASSVIRTLEQKASDEQQPGSRALARIRANLKDNLLSRLHTGPFLQHSSLGCSLYTPESSALEDSDLLARFQSFSCDRIGRQVVANFAISGNVNRPRALRQSSANTFAARLEAYEMECMQADGFEQPDHHSVQLGAASHPVNSTVIFVEPTSKLAPRSGCRRKLDDVTLAYLLTEQERTETERPAPWPVFNLFGQQLGWIGAAGRATESLADSRGPARDRFDRKIAFWANFLPTLNCSRTQPLGANALAQAQNSTLLNMNLNFNCHQGARTASSVLQSIQTKIKTNLLDWIGAQLAKQQQRWLNGSVNTVSTQNHHSLRMAAGNESQLDELNLDAERQFNRSSSGMAPMESGALKPTLNGRLLSLLPPSASLLGVWMICGTVLVGSTLLAAGCTLAQRLRHPRRVAKKQSSQGGNLDPVGPGPGSSSKQMQPGEPASCDGPLASDLLPSNSQPADQYANYNGYELPLEAQRSASFIDHSVERQQHQQEMEEQQQETILLPIISTPHYFATQRQQAAEPQHLLEFNSLTNSNAATTQQQQRQQPTQVLSSSSETTTITNRPQSSVSLVSGSTNTTNPTNNDTNGTSRQQTNKKRVKISDPKRLLEPNYMSSQRQGPESQLYLEHHVSSEQQKTNGVNFCPVHRAGSTNYLLQADSPLGYEASTAFLTNGPTEGARYLDMVEGASGLATIGSLADYLNLLTPHQADGMALGDAASNSLRFNSQRRLNKSQGAGLRTSGLCRMHSNQTMGFG